MISDLLLNYSATYSDFYQLAMESLPDVILEYILSHINNARDVAACNCVSKIWKDSTPYIRSLYFPGSSFDNPASGLDNIVKRMVSRVVCLEELIVYSPFFSPSGLASWLSLVAPSLRHLEIQMDVLSDYNYNNYHAAFHEIPSKLYCVGAARNLESLKLWSVLMVHSPNWGVFPNLKNLEIVGVVMEDSVLTLVLQSCPFLTRFLLVRCQGVESLSIELPFLEQCKLVLYGLGDSSLTLTSPKIESLEIEGCSWIRVSETKHLRKLSISNFPGTVDMVYFGNLAALEFLSMRGKWWNSVAICKMLKLASEVKHLYVKVDFTGDHPAALQSFPEMDFVDFFNSHQKLQKLDIHEVMFAALCQNKNSLKYVDSGFVIPFLEEVVITVRSPLYAEQKMSALESLLKYGKSLRTMIIKILDMKNCHNSTDDFFDRIFGPRYTNYSTDEFFDKILQFRYVNPNIVRIE